MCFLRPHLIPKAIKLILNVFGQDVYNVSYGVTLDSSVSFFIVQLNIVKYTLELLTYKWCHENN